VIGAAILFLGLPMLAVVARGAPALLTLSPSIWEAALRSILIALSATLICFALSLAIAWVLSTGRTVLAEGVVLIGLTASSLVIGTGLFILLRPIADPFALALPLTAVVNAVMGVPFALRVLLPAVATVRRGQGRLAASLGLSSWVWMRHVLLPGIRRPAGFALGLVAAFSMGDLGIIALFGTSGTTTLPLEMAQLMGAYRMEAAAGAGALLLILSFALFALFDAGGRYDRAG
jgi:thiamine transport system permease protein